LTVHQALQAVHGRQIPPLLSPQSMSDRRYRLQSAEKTSLHDQNRGSKISERSGANGIACQRDRRPRFFPARSAGGTLQGSAEARPLAPAPYRGDRGAHPSRTRKLSPLCLLSWQSSHPGGLGWKSAGMVDLGPLAAEERPTLNQAGLSPRELPRFPLQQTQRNIPLSPPARAANGPRALRKLEDCSR